MTPSRALLTQAQYLMPRRASVHAGGLGLAAAAGGRGHRAECGAVSSGAGRLSQQDAGG